jgi:hypothetical protein
MNYRRYLFLFLLGLTVMGFAADLEGSPGYMDADYYFATGQRLAEGFGFTEDFLWNYLDDPEGLPHPSHAYWMPLTSLVVSLSMKITHSPGFWGGRILLLLFSGVIPPLTAALAYAMTRRRDIATLAGVLALFPGYYLPFLVTTDTFALYMLLGGSFLLLAYKPGAGPLRYFGLGLLAGLAHLARADGGIWFVLALSVAWGGFSSFQEGRPWLKNTLLVVGGYGFVIGPWILRNWFTFGVLLSPGGSRALWLTDYNELFIYPARQLTPGRWWSSGMVSILSTRFRSLALILGRAFVEQGLIFLTPLVLWAALRLRDDPRVRLGAVAWLLNILVMGFVFPEPGWRGGFFHSGAGLQPLIWALAAVGLSEFVTWGNERRGWSSHQAWQVFSAALIVFAMLLTGFAMQQRVLGPDLRDAVWDDYYEKYLGVEAALEQLDEGKKQIVMVNNPPGYHLASGRPAIMVPDGGEQVLLAAGQHYQAAFLILDQNHPEGLKELYGASGDRPGLRFLMSDGDIRLFEFDFGSKQGYRNRER